MPHRIMHFTGGTNPALLDKLNDIVDVINAVLAVRGDQNIKVQLVPGVGFTFKFYKDQIIGGNGNGGTVPAPEFQYEIYTGVDNAGIFDDPQYAPPIPNS